MAAQAIMERLRVGCGGSLATEDGIARAHDPSPFGNAFHIPPIKEQASSPLHALVNVRFS